MDIIVVGGALETGRATGSAYAWKKRFGSVPSVMHNMVHPRQSGTSTHLLYRQAIHGTTGAVNMGSGLAAFLLSSFSPVLSFLNEEDNALTTLHPCQALSWGFAWLHVCTVPVMAITAYRMGSVAMGTFRVDCVYKLGAACWLIPFLDLLYFGMTMDRLMLLLGYSQAFAFVRVASPISLWTLQACEWASLPVPTSVKALRWDVAASSGILMGMFLSLEPRVSGPLAAATMALAFGILPYVMADDCRIAAGDDAAKKPRDVVGSLVTNPDGAATFCCGMVVVALAVNSQLFLV
jgi:hypothetical protein